MANHKKAPQDKVRIRTVSLPQGLGEAVDKLAEQEYLSFSATVTRLVREALEARKQAVEGAVKRTNRPHSKAAVGPWATAPPDVIGSVT